MRVADETVGTETANSTVARLQFATASPSSQYVKSPPVEVTVDYYARYTSNNPAPNGSCLALVLVFVSDFPHNSRRRSGGFSALQLSIYNDEVPSSADGNST
uniref:Uncharacterized protein n=1 Tax=Peronospora matthiolae TaxID=2874970 RepID=A0AAV1UMK8_9STRA